MRLSLGRAAAHVTEVRELRYSSLAGIHAEFVAQQLKDARADAQTTRVAQHEELPPLLLDARHTIAQSQRLMRGRHRARSERGHRTHGRYVCRRQRQIGLPRHQR